MVLKNVDDKSKIIDGLYTLLKHPKLYDSKKEQAKKLAEKLKKGWRNEKDASYYINSYFKHRKDMVVLHDLRLVSPEETLQIDHLLIFRFLIVVFESKFFSSSLHYDPRTGEFYLTYSTRKKFAIPDPVKQAERQTFALGRFLREKNLEKYFPKLKEHFVLVSPRVKFSGKMPERVLKADKFVDKFKEEDEKMGIGTTLIRAVEFFRHSNNMIAEGAKKLISYHRPFTLNYYLKQLNLEWTKEWIEKEVAKKGKN